MMERPTLPKATQTDDARERASGLLALATRVGPSRLLVIGTVIVLALGWFHTWPNLNRDFDHLHGWEHAQDAQLARMFVDEGPRRLGFGPAAYALHDAGGNYRYYTHYSPLPHLLIAAALKLTPAKFDHLGLRIAGIVTTAIFLIALYLFGRRLFDARFAAWLLFFGAVGAEVWYFGIFPAMYVLGSAFVAIAYCVYLGWRGGGQSRPPVLTIVCLIGAYLCWVGFYAAALPIVLDLLRFDPAGRGKRRWTWVAVIGVLPVLVFVAVQAHYRYGIGWLTGKSVWASDFRANLAARGHYSLWYSPEFYRRLGWDAVRYVSPVGVGAVVVYLIDRVLRPRKAVSSRREKWSWQSVFVASTFAMLAFMLAFPQSTIDHEFEYFQLIIPLALVAALFIVRRGVLYKVAASVATVGIALGTTGYFEQRNNTPQSEFEMGVAVRLATPTESYVRVPLSGAEFYPMLLYYSNRNLLFDVPQEFRPVVAADRFEVRFGTNPVPDGVVPIDVPTIQAMVLDAEPGARPRLPNAAQTYGDGAWRLDGAGITGRYDQFRLVEIEWTRVKHTREPLAIEIGQWVNGVWSTIDLLNLRGNTLTAAEVRRGVTYRDGYVVRSAKGSRIALRVFDRASGRYRPSDRGTNEIPLGS